MKQRRLIYFLNGVGWFILLLALVMGRVRDVGGDPGLYLKLQKQAGVHETAGVSDAELVQLDVNIANYLMGKYDDPNIEIEVQGQMQPAFNERELAHLADCRRLFAPMMSLWLNIGMAVVGVGLVMLSRERMITKGSLTALCTASAVIVLPLAVLGIWAAVDFDAAFAFFHRLLFTNDLWMLNPETDLLIRICPASMFAAMGLRIAWLSALILLGVPALAGIGYYVEKKRKTNESAEL